MKSNLRITTLRVVVLGAAIGLAFIAYSYLRWGEIRYVGRHGEWSIGIYVGPDPLHLSAPDDIDNPVITLREVTDIQASLVADPFVVRDGSRWYMFFEAYNVDSRNGEIALATSPDGFTWTYERIVLAEPFHLSFPHIFAWGGDYYMIPESKEANSLRLYRAEEFPWRWSLVGSLLDGRFKDPVVFRRGDRWWLFAETGPDANDTLRLFHAESLEGTWTEHPASPVVDGDPSIARPAGRVIQLENRLIRFAQDDDPTYGNAVHAIEITRLTVDNYDEAPIGTVPVLEASGRGWNSHGMHHLDAHRLEDGRWLGIVDGLRVSWGIGRGH
jgi:hypothetical protein